MKTFFNFSGTLIFTVFVILGFGANAQTLKVLNARTGLPVDGVLLVSERNSAQTNSAGIAIITGFGNADTIWFKHQSYLPFHTTKIKLGQAGNTVMLTENPVLLEEVVVSVNRWEQLKRETPQTIKIIKAEEVLRYNPQSAADLVSQNGNVFVQKSQMGGGSPMVRGFSANRVLIVVDGIRMNNAIYRNGNLHNIISVDGLSTESTEIIFGPGSVIYGSDALGGVFSFNTLQPKLSANDKTDFSGKAFTRYSSANSEKTIHADFKSGIETLAAVVSATYTDFDDLHMGSNGPQEYLRPEYVSDAPFTGKDVVIKNENQKIEKYTAYNQFNLLGKIMYKPSDYLGITLSAHLSQTGNIPRYDRLIEYKGQNLTYAEWYYGPQVWNLFALNLKFDKKNAFFDKMMATAGYQKYEESRYDRKLNNALKNGRKEKLGIYTLNIDFDKAFSVENEVFYGIEGNLNHVYSNGESNNLLNGETVEIAPRYPDDSDYQSAAAYFSYKHKADEKFVFDAGVRYSYTHLEGIFDTTFYHFPFDGFNMSNQALNGNLGLIWHPGKNWQVNAHISTGFRSPNIDDVSRVFDSEPGNVVVPNPELEPEYARNYELNISKNFAGKARFEIAFYYSKLKNAMVRRDFSLNGQDSMMYDGTMSKIEALVNTESATIWGSDLNFEYIISGSIRNRTNFTLTRGKDAEGFPVRHVPPTFGSSHLIFERQKIFIDLYVNFSGKLDYDELAPDEQDKPNLYLPDENGNPYSPAWWTINLKSSYAFSQNFTFTAGVENITDKRYRSYSSGIVSPGINFTGSVVYRF